MFENMGWVIIQVATLPSVGSNEQKPLLLLLLVAYTHYQVI